MVFDAPDPWVFVPVSVNDSGVSQTPKQWKWDNISREAKPIVQSEPNGAMKMDNTEIIPSSPKARRLKSDPNPPPSHNPQQDPHTPRTFQRPSNKAYLISNTCEAKFSDPSQTVLCNVSLSSYHETR